MLPSAGRGRLRGAVSAVPSVSAPIIAMMVVVFVIDLLVSVVK